MTDEKPSASLFSEAAGNFVVYSTVATLVSIVLTTAFLSTYLGTFDWSLLWYVEATDFAKFGMLLEYSQVWRW
jgi:hypothetical protein